MWYTQTEFLGVDTKTWSATRWTHFAAKMFINLKICSFYLSFTRTTFHRLSSSLLRAHTISFESVVVFCLISILLSAQDFSNLYFQYSCFCPFRNYVILKMQHLCCPYLSPALLLHHCCLCTMKIIHATRRKQLVVCDGVIRNARFNLCLSWRNNEFW